MADRLATKKAGRLKSLLTAGQVSVSTISPCHQARPPEREQAERPRNREAVDSLVSLLV